jgi:hypothetical protein
MTRPALDPNLLNQLAAKTVQLAFLFEGHFATTSLYLWTGLGQLVWNGMTFEGAGELIGIGEAKETSDMQAVGLTVSLSGVSPELIALALSELRQGQTVNVYIAAYQWANGAAGLLSNPYCFFQGRVDVPSIDFGAETAMIALQIENRLVDFERQRVRYYDPTTQQIFYPADKGFDYVAALQDQKIFWGISN